MLGFYFSLQGNGQVTSNDVTVTATSGATYTYALGDNDSDGNTDGLLSLYETGALLGNGVIDKSAGNNGPNYVVSYVLGEFANITSVSWFGATTANTRIDDIVVSSEVPAVPLPAGGLLLLSGLFSLGYVARRRA